MMFLTIIKELWYQEINLIDNVENILANKLAAVVGRDNPKYIFDIYLISKYSFFHGKRY